MRKIVVPIALSAALVSLAIAPAAAQSTGAVPVPVPSLPPGPLGASFDASRLAVTSAANEHGAFLWIVDSIQHAVMLCEKTEAGKEFSCTRKKLP
ncbi:MAG TPA: hypothetical protein VFA50_09935 [Stellaceae bacterium]|nr:hypothetical protein [Stellaceae bacterium]